MSCQHGDWDCDICEEIDLAYIEGYKAGRESAEAAIQRVRELHRSATATNAACGDPDCCGEYEEFEVCIECECEYPCDTIKALDGEIGSVEPVKLEALDGEQ